MFLVITNIFTPTRTSVSPYYLRGINFDTLNDLNGWHTDYNNYKWIQTNGDSSSFIGFYGPGSDYTSISKFNPGRKGNFYFVIILVWKILNSKIGKSCSIPFSFPDGLDKPEYYCRKSFFRKDKLCGVNSYPAESELNSAIVCNSGNYYI